MNVETGHPGPPPSKPTSSVPLLVVSWLWVGLPLAYGVSQTVIKSLPMFGVETKGIAFLQYLDLGFLLKQIFGH